MSLTDYLENNIINWMRGVAMPAPPAQLFIELLTTNDTEAGGGTAVAGVSDQAVALTAPPASSAGAAGVLEKFPSSGYFTFDVTEDLEAD